MLYYSVIMLLEGSTNNTLKGIYGNCMDSRRAMKCVEPRQSLKLPANAVLCVQSKQIKNIHRN